MLYLVSFNHRCPEKELDCLKVHGESVNQEFWKGVKAIAAKSKIQNIKKWATRSPCNTIPLCMRIDVYTSATDDLTGEMARCHLRATEIV